MSGSGKSEQEHVPQVKTRKFSGRFTLQSCCSHANQRQGNVQESVLQLDLLFSVFHSSGQGHPMTIFCKISFRRSKYCLRASIT